MEKEPVRVLVTGAAGQIGHVLVPMIARGVMLGPDQPVILHMLGNPHDAKELNGLKSELVDSAFPLLKDVVATTNVVEACTGINIAILIGAFQRKSGMEMKGVMSTNALIYESLASALEQYAAANCKVLVVANHTNTIALILKEFAPSIPKKNITCLTRLDHNRALGQISERLNVQVSDVKNVAIWGYDSLTQYVDVRYATVKTPSGEKPVRELVADDAWLRGKFIATVQQRGAAIIKARKLSYALSAASSACDHIHDWVLGTPEGTWVSMGVYSDGSYGVPAGLIHSFPVTCRNGEWTVVQGLLYNHINHHQEEQRQLTANSASECMICLSNGGELKRGRMDCCDHYFHIHCIMTWSKKESRCPICKRRFSTVEWLFNDANQGNVNVVVNVPVRDQGKAATQQPTDRLGTEVGQPPQLNHFGTAAPELQALEEGDLTAEELTG